MTLHLDLALRGLLLGVHLGLLLLEQGASLRLWHVLQQLVLVLRDYGGRGGGGRGVTSEFVRFPNRRGLKKDHIYIEVCG